MNNVRFYKSEELSSAIKLEFKKQKQRILEFIPGADVQHVGGSSIPGALTLGDLDINIRVSQDDFSKATKFLRKIYHENHPEMWKEGFALFHRKDYPLVPISVMLTEIDSRSDEYVKIRNLLMQNKDKLEEYNQFKRECAGKDEEIYLKAKRNFFGPNGQCKLLK